MERNVMLYKKEGAADKVYSLELKAGANGMWDVTFRNARRGQALKLAKSLPNLPLEAANKQFEKQLAAKKGDGYTEDQAGQAYTSSEFSGRASGLAPQLPKPIEQHQALALLHDDDWALQEKANGENRILIKKGGELRGTNKKGLFVDIPANWSTEWAALPDCELAGEHVGDAYFAFDLLSLAGVDLRARPFDQRFAALANLVGQQAVPSFKVLQAFVGPAKSVELSRLEAGNREGGVFKRRDAPFSTGYTDAALKYKFIESTACVVLAHNQQRSVQIGLIGEAGEMVPVGNVTIPANKPVPAVGDVAEIEYLYFNPGGAFEQPVFLRVRTDMDASEAVLTQVTRYKPDVHEQRQRERERC